MFIAQLIARSEKSKILIGKFIFELMNGKNVSFL